MIEEQLADTVRRQREAEAAHAREAALRSSCYGEASRASYGSLEAHGALLAAQEHDQLAANARAVARRLRGAAEALRRALVEH
jgi:hypothetical protein